MSEFDSKICPKCNVPIGLVGSIEAELTKVKSENKRLKQALNNAAQEIIGFLPASNVDIEKVKRDLLNTTKS